MNTKLCDICGKVVNNSIFDNPYVNLTMCENSVWKNYDFCIDCSKKISEAVHRTIEENKGGDDGDKLS